MKVLNLDYVRLRKSATIERGKHPAHTAASYFINDFLALLRACHEAKGEIERLRVDNARMRKIVNAARYWSEVYENGTLYERAERQTALMLELDRTLRTEPDP